jgi:LPPG:FO 2-phospho-L-lactate transferase
VIFIAPSNPLASVGPILAVPGIRRRLGEPRAPIVVVSPIVGGRSLKGPTDKFLRWAKLEVSPLGVAQFYQSVLGSVEGMLIDRVDEKQASAIEALGFRVHVGDIIMPDAEAKRQVARLALRLREDL